MPSASKSSKVAVEAFEAVEAQRPSAQPAAFPCAADALDASYLVSPARAQQAWLEAALASGEPPKFSYGSRLALIVGASGVLWLCIGVVTAIALS